MSLSRTTNIPSRAYDGLLDLGPSSIFVVKYISLFFYGFYFILGIPLQS